MNHLDIFNRMFPISHSMHLDPFAIGGFVSQFQKMTLQDSSLIREFAN
jgi:hypothetical protein